MGKIAATIWILLSALSCASDESRVLKKTYFGGEKIDVDQLSYFDLATGEKISLARYMDENSLRNVMLIFGSVGCAKCNEKAKVLSHQLMGKHALFLDSQEFDFELIGVNTDVGSARRRFDQIWHNEQQKKQAGYDFVRWSDPGAETVKTQLLKAGSNFAIPFMVVLSRDSLLARYVATDTRGIDAVLDDVRLVLEGKAPGEGPSDGGGDSPGVDEGPLDPAVAISPAAIAKPGRFARVKGYDCQSLESVNLSQLLSGAGRRYMHLAPANCDKACQENRALFAGELAAHCERGKRCAVLDYRYDASGGASCDGDFLGKTDLRALFETSLNWRAELVNFNSWGEPDTIGEDTRSYVLVFDDRDQLIAAKSGAVSLSELTAAVPGKDYIPEFKLLGASDHAAPATTQTLRDLLAKARYTVFYEYGPGCESCDKKLVKWSRRDVDDPGLLQFCRESAGFCSLYALNVPIPGLNTPSSAYDDTLAHMRSKGARVPLLVDHDVIRQGPSADSYARFYEGYLRPYFRKQWADEFGGVLNGATVIYDSEGKVVMSFAPSADPNAKDLVAQALKALWKYHGGR